MRILLWAFFGYCVGEENGGRIKRVRLGERVGFSPLDGELDRIRLHSATIISLLANDEVKYPYDGNQRIKKKLLQWVHGNSKAGHQE